MLLEDHNATIIPITDRRVAFQRSSERNRRCVSLPLYHLASGQPLASRSIAGRVRAHRSACVKTTVKSVMALAAGYVSGPVTTVHRSLEEDLARRARFPQTVAESNARVYFANARDVWQMTCATVSRQDRLGRLHLEDTKLDKKVHLSPNEETQRENCHWLHRRESAHECAFSVFPEEVHPLLKLHSSLTFRVRDD